MNKIDCPWSSRLEHYQSVMDIFCFAINYIVKFGGFINLDYSE